MNKKGFTLVELIVILVIIGVIVTFSLPNITSTLERNKKDQMIIDAKDMVDKAKNYILKNSYNDGVVLKLKNIDIREEIKDSPFGNKYDRENSCVKRSIVDNQYKYKICLEDNKYKLMVDDVSDLLGSDKYTKIEDNVDNCSCS